MRAPDSDIELRDTINLLRYGLRRNGGKVGPSLRDALASADDRPPVVASELDSNTRVDSHNLSMRPSRVQLHFRPLSNLGYHHAYITVTSPEGDEYFLSAAPENRGGSDQLNVRSELVPHYSNGGKGELIINYGDYAKEFELGRNYRNLRAPEGVTIGYIYRRFAEVIDELERYGRAVESAPIPYRALSTNSNAFARGALASIGFHDVKNPDEWAPGWEMELPIRAVGRGRGGGTLQGW